MLTIKNRVMLLKLKRLVNKQNKEFARGNYAEAAYYGELVGDYITNVMKLEEGVPN